MATRAVERPLGARASRPHRAAGPLGLVPNEQAAISKRGDRVRCLLVQRGAFLRRAPQRSDRAQSLRLRCTKRGTHKATVAEPRRVREHTTYLRRERGAGVVHPLPDRSASVRGTRAVDKAWTPPLASARTRGR